MGVILVLLPLLNVMSLIAMEFGIQKENIYLTNNCKGEEMFLHAKTFRIFPTAFHRYREERLSNHALKDR